MFNRWFDDYNCKFNCFLSKHKVLFILTAIDFIWQKSVLDSNEMWTNQFLKLFFVIFIGVEGVSGGISHVEDENLVIPKYISRLIQSQNLKVPSQNHDVALIGLEVKKEQKSEIFGQILGAILEENPENGVYTHQESSRIPKHRVDEVAFIIIVTDVLTFVSILHLLYYF